VGEAQFYPVVDATSEKTVPTSGDGIKKPPVEGREVAVIFRNFNQLSAGIYF
jgi:hypothetical protein